MGTIKLLAKTFAQVVAGEQIFTINPIEGTIIPLLVKEVREPKIFTSLVSKESIVIEYYLLKPVRNVTLEDLLKRANETQVEVKIGRLVAPKIFTDCITGTMPPLVYATTEDALLSWSKMRKR